MLARAGKAAAESAQRVAGANHAAVLDLASIDPYARARQDSAVGSTPQSVKRSPEAVRGRVPKSDTGLPVELREAVETMMTAMDHKDAVHTRAQELWHRLRRTTLEPQQGLDIEKVAYDSHTSLAYLLGIMPNVYLASVTVFETLKRRLELLATESDEKSGEAWQPDRLVDYGSGTGSAAWAFEQVWGVQTPSGASREYVGFDSARAMVELSSGILGALPQRFTDEGGATGAVTSGRLDARSHQVQLPIGETSLAKLNVSRKSYETKKTIALAAFSLGDMPTRRSRRDLVKTMWNSGAEVIVIIDRGTPRGSKLVADAREQLLSYGRNEVNVARGVTVEQEEGFDEVAEMLRAAGVDAAPEMAAETALSEELGDVDPSLGSYVLAPMPSFMQRAKGTQRGEDDVKYSYVIIRRGQRPPSGEPKLSVFAELLASLEKAKKASKPEESASASPPSSPDTTVASIDANGSMVDPAVELAFPRIIAPPMKGSGHITLDVCAPSGELERHVISKRQGRQIYYDARKSNWGDAFPHTGFSGPEPSPYGREVPQEKMPNQLGDKFEGSSKRRAKKAVRQASKGAVIDFRYEDKTEAREERASRRAQQKAERQAREAEEASAQMWRQEEERILAKAAKRRGKKNKALDMDQDFGIVEYELDEEGELVEKR
ncbi:37S ribosomal protein S22 [Rhodotorula toruloides]